MDENQLGQLLFSGGISLAGLILVFLGFVLTAYSLYDATERRSVKRRYQIQAWLAFLGFSAAILVTLSGLLPTIWASPSIPLVDIGVWCLLASLAILCALAVMVLKEVS